MKLFNLLLVSTFIFGSFVTSYSTETVTTGSCFSNPSTYIGKNIPIAGAAINVWQVMQGMEALTLLLNVQEKDIHPRLDLLPVLAKDLVKRVLKKIKRTYPKFLSDRTIRENKNENSAEYGAHAWYAIPNDLSPIDIMRAVREYLQNNSHTAKDAKNYMQLHWYLWMLLSTVARGLSFGDTYEGVRSSVMVGGINLLENVAVEAISDRAHLSDHVRSSVHGGVKLGLLCASLCAQLLSSNSHRNEPAQNPGAQPADATVGGQVVLPNNVVPSVHVMPLAPPPPPPLPPVPQSAANRIPVAPPPPPAPLAVPMFQKKQTPKNPTSLAAQLQDGTTLKHVEEADRPQIQQHPSVAQLMEVTLKPVDPSTVKPKEERHLGPVAPDELQKGKEKLKSVEAPTASPVLTKKYKGNALMESLSNKMGQIREQIEPDENTTGSSGTGDSWFETEDER